MLRSKRAGNIQFQIPQQKRSRGNYFSRHLMFWILNFEICSCVIYQSFLEKSISDCGAIALTTQAQGLSAFIGRIPLTSRATGFYGKEQLFV